MAKARSAAAAGESPLPSPTSHRRWGCLTAVAAIAAGVVASAFIPNIVDAIDAADPAAAAPPDLCAAIGPALFERLVPHGAPRTESIYSLGSDAACDYRTPDDRQFGSDTYGFLHVRLLRYGRVAWNSGSDRAFDALGSACDGTAVGGRFHGARGIGDEACTASHDEDNGATAFASAIVRRGADLLWVDYYTHPGAIDQAEHAVPEVVSAAFAAVP